MKRENRLTKNEDFKTVVSKRLCFANQCFVFYYNDNTKNKMRVGISISGKYGNAVERNKAKRQTRMIVNNYFDFAIPLDCVIVIKKNFANKTYKENEEELITLYNKIIKKRGGQQ